MLIDNAALDFNGAWIDSPIGDKLTALMSAIRAQWVLDQSRPPATLYHYTTVNGLHGMLTTEGLWATNIRFLNDASELVYARGVIERVLDKKAASASSPVLTGFLEKAKKATDPQIYDYYVSCFSEEPDLLSQWRAYADHGKGYVIGFISDEIGYRVNGARGVDLRRVEYDEEKQKLLVAGALDQTCELLMSLCGDQTVEQARESIMLFTMFLRDLFADYHTTFKSSDFKQEKEWRIVQSLSCFDRNQIQKHLRFRTTREISVPYVELNICPEAGVNTSKLPINTIVFGSTLDADLAISSIQYLLVKYDHHFVNIRKSNIPIRY